MFAPSRPLSLLYQFAAESPSLVRRGASSVALGGVVKEALEHAKALKKQKQVFHLGKVEELEKQIGSTAPDSSVALAREDGSKLIAAKRRHQLGAFRATAEVESRLRTGETVISIPRFSQMTAQQWASDEGPQLVWRESLLAQPFASFTLSFFCTLPLLTRRHLCCLENAIHFSFD